MCRTCTTETRSRTEVVEALLSLNQAAKRCVPKTRLFNLASPAEAPTQWDRRHADLDALLYWLQISDSLVHTCDKPEVVSG